MIRCLMLGAMLLATAPAPAQVPVEGPPVESVTAIRTFAMIGAARRFCPGLAVNLRRAHILARRFRFDPADLRSRYRPLTRLVSAEFTALATTQHRAFCRLAWSYFGNGGLFPDVLSRQ